MRNIMDTSHKAKKGLRPFERENRGLLEPFLKLIAFLV